MEALCIKLCGDVGVGGVNGGGVGLGHKLEVMRDLVHIIIRCSNNGENEWWNTDSYSDT